MAADALLTDLFKQLASTTVQLPKEDIKLLVGFDEEVQKLQGKLSLIKAMLDDADKRHAAKQRTEKLWLEQLQDKYYEIDDVLDTWSTARIKAEIKKEEGKPADVNAPAVVKKKVCSFFPSPSCCFNLPLRHDLHKIKKLNKKLDKIFNDREKYGVDFNRQPEIFELPITTSFVDESDIIGRDTYRDDLLSVLLGKGSPKERQPHVISLVGMGGLGKTTLAQIAYNHSEVKAHFDKRMWVCVSDPFDQCKVAKAIIESLEGQSPNATELQSLLDKLYSLIGGKRFFLVLDDVWTEESTKWEPFRDALKCGAEGSRILVTTRNPMVAKMMESFSIINLRELSPNDCWLIIKKIAIFDDYGEQYSDLEELGKQLANKCKGLPFAAKLLGVYLRGKMSKKELEKVLHNDLWKLEDIEYGLFGPLFRSYYDLSSSEKQCFLFCAIFPKDYEFNKFELIIHWMAQGYINSKGNMEMEDIAKECFQKLVMCSFFQDFEKDENDGRIESCKMHDIVHDFAKSMTKDVCLTIEGDEGVNINFKRARQLSLIVKETFPVSIYEAKNLRFLNLVFMSSQIVQPKLFDNLACLRTLYLEGWSILELPNEVEKLIHLRLLKLSFYEIEELPESICNLCNLQSLDVSNCWKLEKLPKGLGKLTNLRHLKFSRDYYSKRVVVCPKGIGKLTCLRTLSDFNIGGKDDRKGCKLGELKKLNHLQGTLGIHGLRNVEDVGEAQFAQLKKKIHLRGLGLKFGEFGEGIEVEEEDRTTRRMENDVLVLFAIEPPPGLEILKIGEYMGSVFPNWMMSLTYLKELVLGECWKLECLPPLGKLPLLKELKIWNAPMIRKVGDEFLGIDIEEEELSELFKNNNNKDIIIFPNLKSLKFEELEEWEEWSGMGGTIEEEEEEKDNSANAFVTNNTPKIQIMPRLHSLTIWDCGNLKSLPDYLRNTPLLQKLDIYRYKGTTMYPNWMMSKLTYLKKLYLEECPNLEQLPPLGKLPLLEELVILYAPMIGKVGDEFLGIDIEEEELSESSKDIIIFPNLKSLKFKSLWKWKEWSGMGGTIEGGEEKDNSAHAFVTNNNTPKIQIMPLLHSLTIWNCFNLKSLPDYLRNTPLLQKLEIYGCPILEQRCERGIGDYWPNISRIPNIMLNFLYVQRDGQLKMHDDSDQMHVDAEEAGESSYSFCEICSERKDSDQMFKTASCVHSFCSDCIGKHVATKIRESKTVVTCPGLDCEGVIELDACRAVLPKDVLDRLDEALCFRNTDDVVEEDKIEGSNHEKDDGAGFEADEQVEVNIDEGDF